MNPKSKPLRAFVSSCETQKEEAKPALVPKLRFPEFRGTEAWRKAALGDLMEITSSKRVHESDWTAVGVPFYRAREIVALSNGEPITPLFISEDLYRENAKRSGEIVPGDLLVSGVGSIGIPYLVKPNDRFYFKDGNIIWLKNRDTKLQGQFLLTLYGTQFVQSQIKTMAGVGTVGTYTIDNANKTVVVFPADDIEQQKIAECLSSLDELMAAQARKVEALKTHKKGLMQQLFPREGETQPRLRFPEFQNAGEWEEVALGDIAEIKLGKMLDKQKHTTGHLLPYLNNLAVRWNEVNTSELPKMFFSDRELDRFGLRAGDVVVCEGGEPGRAAVWDGRLPDLKFQKAIHRVRFNVPFEPKILVLHLENLAGTTAFEMLFTGGGIKHLTRETFCRLKIPLIPRAEQQRIATCLSSLDALITAETQKHEALKTHKKGLMQQLFPSLGIESTSTQ